MAIIQKKSHWNSNPSEADRRTVFTGRVVRIVRTTETRNWSDTLDYTDFRTTACTAALVWIGPVGVPNAVDLDGNPPSWRKNEVRDLAPYEQFALIDCTNIHSDRNGYSLEPTVDTFSDQLLHCGPQMIDALAAFDVHQLKLKVEAEAKKAAAEEARKLAEAKEAEKAAKKAAKDAALKAEAEKLLTRIPPKGTTVTIDGFTGKVFWTGASKYYGKWSARAGVKDSRGTVQWIDAGRF